LEDIFVPQILRLAEKLGALEPKDDLHKAGAVAQIAEENASVIAPAVDPSGQRFGFTDITRGQFPAVRASLHKNGLYNTVISMRRFYLVALCLMLAVPLRAILDSTDTVKDTDGHDVEQPFSASE